jgi:DNA-binding transcriptional ArsR family regulator
VSDATDAVFAALADRTRRGLLATIAEAGPVTATQLASELPISRQAVAKHLTVLDRAGLVRGVREGRETRWTATPQPLGEARQWMDRVGAQWDQRLAGLDEHLRSRPRKGRPR